MVAAAMQLQRHGCGIHAVARQRQNAFLTARRRAQLEPAQALDTFMIANELWSAWTKSFVIMEFSGFGARFSARGAAIALSLHACVLLSGRKAVPASRAPLRGAG
jgi:hypothetical protein